ncbi:MAG: fumarylacetoacetate hydrolase family protein [Rhodospirillaceae bacterium]|jgi:fumarylacetoacetate (FAA) hydrolase family protein|nr:fumarylacetoacetate hydrolase family protein [Rhodospirillaceae bacterium]MBT3782903.1 fumarylacetoacetate hydrolase family protein [Rhodospirillaceae bacterium]MBT3977868.1 fumarylacetoacetate hydrolase family protein [Rhodospirillaceae bacterium]MBT4166960.1 fumarylacetoacetate hydrolase family protein [Rhodospirillaceae bacterium]MBT4561473.1 fumarylacetoacetate hydrolase family protein [Rhodospirillaceae bacterium]
MSQISLTAENTLPDGGLTGCFVGRAWLPGDWGGPTPVLVSDEGVFDLLSVAPTLSGLLAMDDPAAAALGGKGVRLGDVEAMLANSAHNNQDPDQSYFLAPADLQALKACGVTFVSSMLERVIEEQAKGDPDKAAEIRDAIGAEIGQSLADITPGSEEAARVKAVLEEQGLWSQYLEVGIGPDAEVFTKSQPMAAVGMGAEIGIHPKSTWNNPEPEIVLAIAPDSRVVGACLGNDVNLRDFEGRSALLLGKAKDNRASCAVGPFIRLFDDGFNLDHVRAMDISLSVSGTDGFELQGSSSIAEISRDLADLATYACGPHNQFPDGLLLFTGTMFAPTEDRDAPGQGFTHHLGDIVTIANPMLGSLTNQINHTDKIPPWTFGVGALMTNLSARNLL